MINDTFNSHTEQNWLARWHIDIPLLFGLLTTGAVGLVVLYSASGQNLDMLINQAIAVRSNYVDSVQQLNVTCHSPGNHYRQSLKIKRV